MKKLILMATASMLAACSSTPVGTLSAQVATPAQVAQVACPVIQSMLITLATPGIGIDATTQADLKASEPIVAAVCQATQSGGQVTVANLQVLGQKVFPSVQAAISASNLPNKDTLMVQVGLGYSVMNVVLASLPAPTTLN